MSSSSGSTDFSFLFRKSSKELYSEKFYDAMEMESDDLHKYNDKCNEILVRGPNVRVIPICKKYLRFLDTSKSWSGLFSVYDVSLLLNYWIYEKLIGIYGDKNSSYITFGFSALQLIWGYYDSKREHDPYYKKCKPDLNIVNHEDWENRKKLYDFYVDFDKLFGSGSTYDSVCKEYYRKIKEMISVCTYFKGKCLTSGTYSCPDNFNKCEEKNLEIELKKLPCHVTINGGRDSSSEVSSSYKPPDPEEPPQDSADGLAAESNTQLYSVNSGIGTKVTNSVLGAAPVLLSATMLYKVLIYFVNIYHYSTDM
ncbi:CYIR protein [Plasmodium cynomolgi strain B]|uniref:CYIR protein n=1 Tax=Plasmodium cynomolgi (strain B) TaxID=1120755 RepID=K6VK49_PLACD|nr:CYIR protein [Plasmodium cynomolgi strain B]GAB69817.1 CYIR protein [Plasmodium cynomolgi strain B]